MEKVKGIFVRTGRVEGDERAEKEERRQAWKWDLVEIRDRLGIGFPSMSKADLSAGDARRKRINTLARIGAWFLLIGVLIGAVSGGISIGPLGFYIKRPPRAPLDCERGDGVVPVKPSPGYRAPNFVGRLPDGTIISLEDCAGMPTVLVFLRTTSAPSIAQVPAVDQLCRECEGRYCVIAIAVFDSEDDVSRYVAAHSWSVPMIADIRGEIAQAYDITAVPTTFIIDKQRIIKDLRIGSLTHAELERALKLLY